MGQALPEIADALIRLRFVLRNHGMPVPTGMFYDDPRDAREMERCIRWQMARDDNYVLSDFKGRANSIAGFTMK